MDKSRYDKLIDDIEQVQKLDIVDTMLEVICRTTGLRFAAIARVTQDRWIACRVRDEIEFGLKDGGELQVDTTLCNEIRDHRQPIVIDHVDRDEKYCNHHTPKMYGFQSYISLPIFLKTGEFFGTLCALDAKPAELNNVKTIGMFRLFGDLLSFHIKSTEVMEASNAALQDLSVQLSTRNDEVRQYQFISNHNLQEPLRKISIYSDMMLNSVKERNHETTSELARKINSNVQIVSSLIHDLATLSEIRDNVDQFELVNLNEVVNESAEQLDSALQSKDGNLIVNGTLPSIVGSRIQLKQLFFHLIDNAITFARKNVPLQITISSDRSSSNHLSPLGSELKPKEYFKVSVKDNGIGIEESQLEKIFDLFSQVNPKATQNGSGIGLSSCRRIVNNHHGLIQARPTPGNGATFDIFLPIPA